MSNPITPAVVQKLVTTNTSASSLVVGGASPVATTGTGGVNAGTVTGNTSVSDPVGTMATIRAGGIGLASQATADFIYAASATQLARLALGTALQNPRVNAAGNGWEFGSLPITLVGGAQGTNTSAAAANMSTIAVSGLTSLDRLLVLWEIETVTQDVTGPVMIYNSTDSIAYTNLIAAGAGVSAGTGFAGWCLLTCSHVDTHKVTPTNTYTTQSGGAMVNFSGGIATMSTLYTGSYNVSFRHSGVVAGGTAHYSWSIFKLAGQ